MSQEALGIAEAEEPYATFLENALAKARHASRAAGLPALADDSGLCVDALAFRAERKPERLLLLRPRPGAPSR
jgi:inosine/xanthosine triphosphate pyrophosphatase family protein